MINSEYLLLLSQKGKSFKPLKKRFLELGGFYNDLGYAFSSNVEKQLQEIIKELPKAQVIKLPLREGQTFEAFQQVNNESFNRDKLYKVETSLLKLKNDLSIEEISEETIAMSSLSNHQKKEILSLLQKCDKLKEKIKWTEGMRKTLSKDTRRPKSAVLSPKEQRKELGEYLLQDFLDDLKKTKMGLQTGFKALDKHITLEAGEVILVAGRPANGKTTTILNMLLNQIKLYPDYTFVLFAYEGTIESIVLKLIQILSEYDSKFKQPLVQLKGYLKIKNNSKVFDKIEKAKETYKDYINNNRLRVFATPFKIQDLAVKIEEITKKEGKIGCVYIDYIQKIKNKERFGTRQLELQNTSGIILETAIKTHLPIILGAQLGRDKDSKNKVKLENLRESGDLEQDSSIVLGIYNPVIENAANSDPNADITIAVLKNRDGEITDGIPFEFNRPLLKIKDRK